MKFFKIEWAETIYQLILFYLEKNVRFFQIKKKYEKWNQRKLKRDPTVT